MLVFSDGRRNWRKLSSRVALLGACLALAAPASATTEEEARRRADEAATLLTRELMSRLQEAMQRGGPTEAVRVCSGVAQDVTRQLAEKEGLSIRRTALRLRNPQNLPDAYERNWLEEAQRTVRAGNTVSATYEVVDLTDGGSELRHLRPIIFPGGVCSQCHGSEEEIAPEVHELLRERYPQDQATGFKAGDLRGAISVRVPMGSDARDRGTPTFDTP